MAALAVACALALPPLPADASDLPAGASEVPAAAASPAPRSAASPAPPALQDAPDPEEVVDEAKGRQRAFERHRRRRLPYAGGRSGDRCDEIVGRYCLWHEDGEDREPPEESESVARERDELLEHLASALRRVPDSDWLVGQRVRYLLEADRTGEALEQATEGCRAAGWWCRALEGLAHHERDAFVRAGRAFDAALAAMEPHRRRRWTDLHVLLEGDARDRWEAADEAGREALARRLWRLADPLWLVAGNDRRTEHLARRVQVRMREDAATPFGSHWNPGLGELTVRYGVPYAFGREPPRPGRLETRPMVVGRHHPDALHWLPSPDALLEPARAEPGGWTLDDPEPRSEHATPYADTTGRLDHWLAVFPRGDTTAIVATWRPSAPQGAEGEEADASGPDPEGDPGGDRSTDPPAEALLRAVPVAALDTATGELPSADDRWSGGARRGLAVRVPTRPHLLSLELLRRDDRRAERARRGLPLARRPEALPGLSDLLVLEAGDSVPSTLEAALPRARPPGPVRPGARLGLYWEIYGPRRLMKELEVSLTLAERGRGLFRRLGRAIGLGDGRVVALGWRDRAAGPGRVHPRGVHLRLPEELSDGDYRLELSVRVPGHEAMTAGRDLTVEGGG